MMYGFSYILIIVAFLITLLAQMRVKNVYSKYSAVPNQYGLTGEQVARRLLNANGLSYIQIERVRGNLSDHYDPKRKVIRLSEGVATQASVAAIGIAAHETGHAIQDALEYTPLKFRNVVYPVCNVGSKLAWPLFIVGLLLSSNFVGTGLMNVGILLYCLVVAFYLITLPVEFNASSRAVKQVADLNLVNAQEQKQVKEVLNAAAMTYVASALMVILQLVRMLMVRGRR